MTAGAPAEGRERRTRSARLVLADDHVLFRETLADLLNAQPGLTVVGQAGDAREAVLRAREERPDLLLLDVQMPYSQGAGTVRALLGAAPRTRILCLSAFASAHLVDEALAAGARGFVHKGVDREALLLAIGRALTQPQHTTVLVPATTGQAPVAEEPLSRREYQVLVCAASALSNRQIADRLDITEGTVKRHLNNVFRKLGAVSRLDAVTKAAQASLIPHPAVPSAEPGPVAGETVPPGDRRVPAPSLTERTARLSGGPSGAPPRRRPNRRVPLR
ncbi:response regulator [Streptomyces sp. JNUCC 64]